MVTVKLTTPFTILESCDSYVHFNETVFATSFFKLKIYTVI